MLNASSQTTADTIKKVIENEENTFGNSFNSITTINKRVSIQDY